jgi:hypothetical protein
MVYWEPITYDDLIILTEWMADQGYSAAQLADAVRDPARYSEQLRTAVRCNADLAANRQPVGKTSEQQAAEDFMAARAADHGMPAA